MVSKPWCRWGCVYEDMGRVRVIDNEEIIIGKDRKEKEEKNKRRSGKRMKWSPNRILLCPKMIMSDDKENLTSDLVELLFRMNQKFLGGEAYEV